MPPQIPHGIAVRLSNRTVEQLFPSHVPPRTPPRFLRLPRNSRPSTKNLITFKSFNRHLHASTSCSAQHSSRDELGDYYAELLAQPLPVSATSTRPINAPPTVPLPPNENRSETGTEPTPAERARIVFGSRLLPPAAREANLEEAKARGEGEWIAGRWIPPRPEEPENCCMSGCVNCVWDVYQEELEEWVATRATAQSEDQRRRARTAGAKMASGIEGDDDGMASGVDLGTLGADSVDDLMQDVPIGIREFMRTEKRLRREKAKVPAAAA